MILGLDHVQLAMPPGGEAEARRFYGEALGLREVPKPASLSDRGGVWFEQGPLKLHLGVDPVFRAARKAHPALLVRDLAALLTRLRGLGVAVAAAEPLPGYALRAHVEDPFGNRIELMEGAGSG